MEVSLTTPLLPVEVIASSEKRTDTAMRLPPLAGTVALLALATSLAAAAVGPAQAAYTVTFSQAGPDVVANGSGTINLNGVTLVQSGVSVPQIAPTFGLEAAGAAGALSGYTTASGPANGFGPGVITNASTGTGDLVAIEVPGGVGGLVFVPQGYVSGAPLSDTATYTGQTFATLGLTPGDYVYNFGFGTNVDTFTVNVGGAAPVPEPASLALLGTATGLLGGFGSVARRRRKAA